MGRHKHGGQLAKLTHKERRTRAAKRAQKGTHAARVWALSHVKSASKRIDNIYAVPSIRPDKGGKRGDQSR